MKSLWPWQIEALELWLRNRKGVVSAVTGGGKTLFALQCYDRVRATIPGLRLAVVVPTLALLDQWVVTVQIDLGVSESNIATYSGEGRPVSPSPVNVLVINTARDLVERMTKDGGPWMLIVDECHRAGSEENARALRGEFVAVLGISATPERQFDDGFTRYVQPVLGPLIYEYDYTAARRDGAIAEFEIHNVMFKLTPQEQAEYDRLTSRINRYAHKVGPTPTQDELARLHQLLRTRARVSINASWRIPTAIATLKNRPGKAILFHERIAAAERLASLLDTGDRRVTTYHSKIYGPTRRERLRLFRLGAFDTLVTCRSLDEGLNVPDAALAMIVASTSSRRQRIQRLGRVLRASSPDKKAVIVTLYATPVEERQLRLEEDRLTDVAGVRWYKAVATNG